LGFHARDNTHTPTSSSIARKTADKEEAKTHNTHTRLSFFSFRVCVQQRHNVYTSNRVKFLTRSAVCFIKTRSVTSHHSRSRVVWMDTIDRRYARTHTHTSDHSTVSEPNFWIHSTGLLNLSPLQNFDRLKGFSHGFLFFL
jgi:hypothetical protein